MKAPSKEIYGKSMQGTNGEKYIQWVTTLSLTMRVYIFIRLAVVASKIWNSQKIQTYTVQGQPRSSILGQFKARMLLSISD